MKNFKINNINFFVLILFFILSCSNSSNRDTLESKKTIAIVGALDREIENLKNMLSNTKEVNIAGINYYLGKLEGKDVVLFKSGVGKVNAAIATTIALEEFNVEKIIFTGVAGGAKSDYDIGDIVISEALVEHDLDTGDTNDNIFYKADEDLVTLAFNSANKVIEEDYLVYIDSIATGDQFIQDENKISSINSRFNVGAVEMEGASLARVAYLFDIPFVVIRSLSDKADGNAELSFAEFLPLASDNSSKIVVEMLKNMN